jgi:hypothetical protein
MFLSLTQDLIRSQIATTRCGCPLERRSIRRADGVPRRRGADRLRRYSVPCISATVTQASLLHLHTALACARRSCAPRRVVFRARWIVQDLFVACVTSAAASARLRRRQSSLAVARSRELTPESVAGLSYTGDLSAALEPSFCAERHTSAVCSLSQSYFCVGR